MSPPAQNARSPAPRRRPTFDVAGSRSKSSSAAEISRTIVRVSALSARGRLSMINPARPRRSTERLGLAAMAAALSVQPVPSRTASMAAATSAMLAMPSTSCSRPFDAIMRGHRGGVAEVGGEPGLEHFRVVVLAHRLAGGLGLGRAIDDAGDQLFRIDLEFDRRVELQPLAREHRVERLGLRHRARKAVENEAVFARRAPRCGP